MSNIQNFHLVLFSLEEMTSKICNLRSECERVCLVPLIIKIINYFLIIVIIILLIYFYFIIIIITAFCFCFLDHIYKRTANLRSECERVPVCFNTSQNPITFSHQTALLRK